MKIAFHIGEPWICGGILIPCQYIGELRKRGIDAWGIATRQDSELEKYMGIPFKTEESLKDLTDNDVIIAVRWEFCEMLEQYKGRKFQLVQARDMDFDCGTDWKEKMSKQRINNNWELIGVSQHCLKDWGRGSVVPNSIHERFFINHNLERDIDVLIIGNEEAHKGIDEAYNIARTLDCKIARLGREVRPREGIEFIFESPAQDEIPKIYQRSKIALILSKSEGFSLPVLEAMASECLVVTKDMGGNDFCEYEWNCTKPENIKYLLKEDKDAKNYMARLRENGYKTAEKYTVDKSTDKLVDFLGVKY